MPKYFHGFDWLRALMSVAVVTWHLQGFGKSLLFSKKDYAQHFFTFSDLINFHVLLLAVPVFFFISFFLYANSGATWEGLKKRFIRIGTLLVFWVALLKIWNKGFYGITFFVPDSALEFALLIINAADTIYYFFVSLLLGLVLIFFINKLNKKTCLDFDSVNRLCKDPLNFIIFDVMDGKWY